MNQCHATNSVQHCFTTMENMELSIDVSRFLSQVGNINTHRGLENVVNTIPDHIQHKVHHPNGMDQNLHQDLSHSTLLDCNTVVKATRSLDVDDSTILTMNDVSETQEKQFERRKRSSTSQSVMCSAQHDNQRLHHQPHRFGLRQHHQHHEVIDFSWQDRSSIPSYSKGAVVPEQNHHLYCSSSHMDEHMKSSGSLMGPDTHAMRVPQLMAAKQDTESTNNSLKPPLPFVSCERNYKDSMITDSVFNTKYKMGEPTLSGLSMRKTTLQDCDIPPQHNCHRQPAAHVPDVDAAKSKHRKKSVKCSTMNKGSNLGKKTIVKSARIKKSTHQVCPYKDCRKLFLCASKLKRHILTHTGEKPFLCYCGQKFSQRASLKVHTKRHVAQWKKGETIREYGGRKVNGFTLCELLPLEELLPQFNVHDASIMRRHTSDLICTPSSPQLRSTSAPNGVFHAASSSSVIHYNPQPVSPTSPSSPMSSSITAFSKLDIQPPMIPRLEFNFRYVPQQ